MNEEKKTRIPNHTAVLMLGVAALYDSLQALLATTGVGIVFGPFVTIIAYLHFWLWFKLRGVGFLDKLDRAAIKRLISFWFSGLLEMVPGADALPMIAINTFFLISITKTEDAIKNKTGQDVRLTLHSPIRALQAAQAIGSPYLSGSSEQNQEERSEGQPSTHKNARAGNYIDGVYFSPRANENVATKTLAKAA